MVKDREAKENTVEGNKIGGEVVYPNPASGELNIQTGNDIEYMVVEIYNTDGKKMYSGKVNSSYMKIDVSRYETGLYLIKIHKSDGDDLYEKVFIK